MQVTIFANRFDNCVRDECRSDTSWPELAEQLSLHSAVSQKDTLMLVPAEFRRLDNIHDFVASGGVLAEQQVWEHGRETDRYRTVLGPDLRPFVARRADNIRQYWLLGVDVDGQMSITTARAKFRRYEYVGATSFGHRTPEKRGRDAFRLWFPLATPMPAAEMLARKDAMLAWIGSSDQSTLARARGFYLPSCRPERLVLAQSWHNQGQWLDWTSFAPVVQPQPSDDLVALRAALRRDQQSPDRRQQVLDRLACTPVRYEPVWANVAVAMVREGYRREDFVAVTAGMMAEKTAVDAERKWRAAERRAGRSRLDMGYLINVIRGKHQRQ